MKTKPPGAWRVPKGNIINQSHLGRHKMDGSHEST